MTIATGTRLGPYEIGSRIGVGGMGEVYRARDTRLDRSVAVKVLPAELANNPQLKVRFEREARAISQLSHPHICTLFDVGDGYLVMELLEGETLAERLTRGPLPLDDVLRYGAEIADALDRAHRAGIIHRDLKPSNIMLTKSGTKLLDFGLARSAVSETPLDGETLHKSITQEGTILGTFQYMAPEQLEAQPADARTDIFALGAVLYEMATGKRAFDGKTRTSIIAAIVSTQPPPISLLQPVTPAAFEHVVQKCLEKDPDHRWQSAHDVAEELRWVATQSGVETRVKRRSPVWPIIAAAVMTIAAIAATAMFLRERAKPRPRVAFTIRAPSGFLLTNSALSPDGQSVAFFAVSDTTQEVGLWLRRFDSLQPTRLATTKRASTLFWSPDGASIGFYDENNSMLRIAATGGRPEVIARETGNGIGSAWGKDGTILFAPRWAEALFKVPASGGKPERVTTLDAKQRETIHAWPVFLDDQQHFLYLVRTVASEQNQIRAGSLDGKTNKLILRADSLVGVARESLYYVRDGVLYASAFDAKNLEVTGTPRRVAEGVSYNEPGATAGASVSRDGAVLYFPVVLRRVSFAWHDRAGRLLQRLHEDSGIGAPRLAPDATRILMMKQDPKKGATDIYTLDLTRRVSTKITGGLANYESALWSSDGSEIYYCSDRDGMYDIYAQSDDGTSPPRLVWQSRVDKILTSIAPDGSFLLADAADPATRQDIWMMPLKGGAPSPLIQSDASENIGRLSPDGKWVLYQSDRSGEYQVYVRRFPKGRSIQVSTNGGFDPRWRRDSSEIFFSDGAHQYAVPLRAAGDVPQVGEAVALFDTPRSILSVQPSPVDDRFLIATEMNPGENDDVLAYLSGN